MEKATVTHVLYHEKADKLVESYSIHQSARSEKVNLHEKLSSNHRLGYLGGCGN